MENNSRTFTESLSVAPAAESQRGDIVDCYRQAFGFPEARSAGYIADVGLDNFRVLTLHAQLGKTMIYVTHDQIEAMTLATKIVVMNRGDIQQIGTPHEVYHRPANLFVARFVGSPTMQMFAGTLTATGSGALFDDGKGWTLAVPGAHPATPGQSVLLGLRPEHIALAGNGGGEDALVEAVEPTGPEDNVVLSIRGQQAIARFPTAAVTEGQTISVALDLDKASLFDAASGLRLN